MDSYPEDFSGPDSSSWGSSFSDSATNVYLTHALIQSNLTVPVSLDPLSYGTFPAVSNVSEAIFPAQTAASKSFHGDSVSISVPYPFHSLRFSYACEHCSAHHWPPRARQMDPWIAFRFVVCHNY